MKVIFEVGDKVEVTSKDNYGICYTNEHGGTNGFPVDTTLACTITKTWYDYETGQRYIGKTDKDQVIYFGEFGVGVKTIVDCS